MSLRSFLNLYMSAALLGAAAFWWVAGSSMILNKRTSFSPVPHVKQSHLTSEPVKPGAYFERESPTPYRITRSARPVRDGGGVAPSYTPQVALSRGVHHEPGSVALPGGRARAYRQMAADAARLCGVEPDLFAALVARESSWRHYDRRGRVLRSSSGAIGLSQIKPSTAREVGLSDPGEPFSNLLLGACYLRQMYDRQRGPKSWRVALHSYRVGPYARVSPAARRYASAIIEGSAQ